MRFDEIIGQAKAAERLKQMADDNRLPHAIMLCGPNGCGKMALAMALASYLLVEKRPASSAYSDDISRKNAEAMMAQWSHPDLHFSYPVIKPAGTSSDYKPTSEDYAKEWHEMIMQGPYFTFDQWLEQMGAANQQAIIFAAESDRLNHKLSLKSSQGGYKVCIVWLPERMNPICANKLLKLLEEPPQDTKFIMVCEDTEPLLSTIKSRTQRIDIRPISDNDIENALVEKRGIDQQTAHTFARNAAGSWIKAVEELNAGSENNTFLDLFIMLMRLAYARNVKDLKSWSDNVATFGRERQKRMLTYFNRMIRENFMYNFNLSELNYMTQEEEEFSKKFARYINEDNIVEMSTLMTRAQQEIAQNANAKVVFFDLALRTITMFVKRKQ